MKADFMIELGDFKDTDVSQHCDKNPSPHCVNITVEFLSKIESVFYESFTGPHYHVLGNHDVDILNQSIVLQNELNAPVQHGGDGYYSWLWPQVPAPAANSSATAGCLVQQAGEEYVLCTSARDQLFFPFLYGHPLDRMKYVAPGSTRRCGSCILMAPGIGFSTPRPDVPREPHR
eukprot:m.350198 g.350198  ORF g.350198 m.350198 type:complete len:175 (-) comp20692_c0_seq24:1874-2398(-)